MAATAMAKDRRSRRKRVPTVLEQLITGCQAERVSVQFLDGKTLEGALLFNAIKRSGKLINIDSEFSIDFECEQVKQIKVLRERTERVS